MKTTIILESDDIKEIHDMLAMWMGMDFTEEQIRTLMDNERDILMQMAQYGVSDTPTRESLMRAIGERLSGKRWPERSATEEQRKAYADEVDAAAEKAGIKVIKQ